MDVVCEYREQNAILVFELKEAREGFLRFARQADLDYPDDIVMKNYRDWLNKQDKEEKK